MQYIIINFVLFVSHFPSEKATISLTVPLLSYPFLIDKLGAVTRYGQIFVQHWVAQTLFKKDDTVCSLVRSKFCFSLICLRVSRSEKLARTDRMISQILRKSPEAVCPVRQTLTKHKSKKYTRQPIVHGSKRVYFFPSESKWYNVLYLTK